MSRKQVELDLGTPALQPVAPRAGQYNVAVQATPKTNSAMQLAQALRMAPQVIGQVNNIAKQMGTEAASQVTDVEEALADDETRGILGYDKAYQQGLVKRHFAANEEAIKERFMNLSRSEDSLKMSPEEFVASMDNERNEFTKELTDMFGGNANREEAINALTGSFVDQLRDSATAQYIENKKDQALMMVSADTQTLFKNQGVSTGLDYMRTEMDSMGVNLKPSAKAQKMRDAVTSNAEALIAEGRYSEASSIINDASSYKVVGNATLFGSAQGKDDLRKVKKALAVAREAAESSFSDNSKGVERSVDALMQDIADPKVTPEERTASALRMATRAGVPPEDAEAFAESVGSGSIDDFITAYRDLARNATNENTRDLLNDQLGEINRSKKEYFGGSASTIGTFSADDMSELESSIREVLDLNPNTTRTSLPMSVNGRKVNFQDPDYIEMMNRVNRDYEWATVPTQKGSIIREAQKTIRSKDARFGEYANEYAVAIQTDINEIAPSLWRQAQGDIAVYEGLIADKTATLQAEYKRRADLRGATESLLDIDLSSSNEAEAIGEAQGNRTVRDMPSFSGEPVSVKDMLADRKTLASIETTGKRTINKSEKRRLIQASLLNFGFPTMESLDLELLNEANMGFQDVLLGDSVLRKMIPALRGYQAGESATAEQKDSMRMWEEYGFDSEEDFLRIEEAQTTLRNLNNRQ